MNKHLYIGNIISPTKDNEAKFKVTGSLIKGSIYRTFNDFLLFREKLKESWPCIYIPRLPSELTKEFCSLSSALLNGFLSKIASMKELRQIEAMKIFLSENNKYKQNMCNINKKSLNEIAMLYIEQYRNMDLHDYDREHGYNQLTYYNKVITNAQTRLNNILYLVRKAIKDEEKEKERILNTLSIFEQFEKQLGLPPKLSKDNFSAIKSKVSIYIYNSYRKSFVVLIKSYIILS